MVTMTGAVVELRGNRPPHDRGTAMALAREQFLNCGDSVWQGRGDLESLAATLIDAPAWYIRWD